MTTKKTKQSKSVDLEVVTQAAMAVAIKYAPHEALREAFTFFANTIEAANAPDAKITSDNPDTYRIK